MTHATPGSLAPLRDFVAALTALVDAHTDEAALLAAARPRLAALLADDTWLPRPQAQADPARYAQHLLYLDPQQRFSVVSFVWGPGQRTPAHDHTVWGLIGMLRGAEDCQEFEQREGGLPVASGQCHRLRAGQIEAVSPTLGDWHLVANAVPDAVSISIHVYGGNIGTLRRHRLDEQGQVVDFVSGYSVTAAPLLFR